MEFAGVYHKTSEQMSYALDENQLVVNIKTGYDVKKIFIHYGDPFDAGILGGNEKWTGKREEIVYKKRLSHQIWWTTTLLPVYKRCKYYFELHTEKEVWYYFEDGFLTEDQLKMDGRMLQCFVVPWMNPADINRTPSWVNDTIWYQIFPDRFCNGTPEKNGEDILPWRNQGRVTNEEKFGGNLEGIRQKLSYLENLGITGIYLNPIMEAESNHKYDTTDYTKIDPSFGNGDTMKVLCKEAHEKGIRIMVDAVFNHCGRKFAPWMDVLKNGKNSRYADWFMVENWEQIGKRADTRDRRFYSFAFSDGMPKLNTNNEEVIQYFCKICEDWIRDYDIDGIRFDVGNEYDSVMNYPLLSGIHDFFLDQTMKKEEFEYMVNRCYTMYMQQNNNVLFNLLDSHDTERLINRLHNLDIFYQQLAILFTLPGSPCIYYGTEIAMEGAHDPDCRRCMPWSEIESDENQERIGTINRLIMLRRNEKTCRSLHFHFPNTYENGRCVEYVKIDEEGNKIEVLLNASNENVRVKGEGEILFARKFDGDILGANGTLIRKIEVTIQ